MIPEIIHQTWKTRDLPENFQKWHNLVKELHPGWKVNLWTDEDNLDLVRKHFPHMLDLYQSLEYNIMRADIIRYMYMSIYGGYYLDMDYELFVPLDNKIYNTELLLPLSRERDKERNSVIGNCIFGSISHHPFWKDILNEFYANPPLKKIYNQLRILKLTGPQFISRIYFKNPKKYNGTLLPRNIFHPNSDMNKMNNYKDFLLKTGSRGIHHCEGSWLITKNPFMYIFYKIYSRLLSFSLKS